MQGVIDASMGGGGPLGPQAWQDCNVNDLTDLQRYDPISGFPVYKALLCNVVKVDETVAIAIASSSEENSLAETGRGWIPNGRGQASHLS